MRPNTPLALLFLAACVPQQLDPDRESAVEADLLDQAAEAGQQGVALDLEDPEVLAYVEDRVALAGLPAAQEALVFDALEDRGLRRNEERRVEAPFKKFTYIDVAARDAGGLVAMGYTFESIQGSSAFALGVEELPDSTRWDQLKIFRNDEEGVLATMVGHQAPLVPGPLPQILAGTRQRALILSNGVVIGGYRTSTALIAASGSAAALMTAKTTGVLNPDTETWSWSKTNTWPKEFEMESCGTSDYDGMNFSDPSQWTSKPYPFTRMTMAPSGTNFNTNSYWAVSQGTTTLAEVEVNKLTGALTWYADGPSKAGDTLDLVNGDLMFTQNGAPFNLSAQGSALVPASLTTLGSVYDLSPNLIAASKEVKNPPDPALP